MARQHRLSAAICAGILALTVGPAVAIAGSAPSAARATRPSAKQIRLAVAKAERSSHLWATVNACAPKGHPHLFGVRAQEPALGFRSWLKITIQVQYWDTTKQQWLIDPAPGTTQAIGLGFVTFGFQQGGFTFKFPNYHGRLRALVSFEWHHSGKVIGTTVRRTTGGHHDADFARPKGYSAPNCTLV
jgi:hypothetical protein